MQIGPVSQSSSQPSPATISPPRGEGIRRRGEESPGVQAERQATRALAPAAMFQLSAGKMSMPENTNPNKRTHVVMRFIGKGMVTPAGDPIIVFLGRRASGRPADPASDRATERPSGKGDGRSGMSMMSTMSSRQRARDARLAARGRCFRAAQRVRSSLCFHFASESPTLGQNRSQIL